jgi:hypothetical protein
VAETFGQNRFFNGAAAVDVFSVINTLKEKVDKVFAISQGKPENLQAVELLTFLQTTVNKITAVRAESKQDNKLADQNVPTFKL